MKNSHISNDLYATSVQFSSVQFSHSVVSNSLRPHESQHASPPCPSPSPGVHSDSRPLSPWCHPAISPSVIPFSSCPQSLPASEYFALMLLKSFYHMLPVDWSLVIWTFTVIESINQSMNVYSWFFSMTDSWSNLETFGTSNWSNEFFIRCPIKTFFYLLSKYLS